MVFVTACAKRVVAEDGTAVTVRIRWERRRGGVRVCGFNVDRVVNDGHGGGGCGERDHERNQRIGWRVTVAGTGAVADTGG